MTQSRARIFWEFFWWSQNFKQDISEIRFRYHCRSSERVQGSQFGAPTIQGYHNSMLPQIRDVSRCHHIATTVNVLMWSQWWNLGSPMFQCYHSVDASAITVVPLQGSKSEEEWLQHELLRWRMAKLTWWMEEVSSLSCKGLGRLILKLLKEEFWLGFPL